MQLIWLLPSLGFSLVLGFISGQWLMAAFSLTTVLAVAMGFLVKQNQTAVTDADEIHWGLSRVAIGNRKLPRLTFFWKPEHRKRLTDQVLAENRMRLAQLSSRSRLARGLGVQPLQNCLRYFSGFIGNQELEIDLVAQGPHAFICGPTGSGKSQYLTLLLGSLRETYVPAELQLVTIDFKGGATLNSFDAIAATTDLAENHAQVFEFIRSLLSEREQKLATVGVSRIEELPGSSRVIVAVDELAAVLQVRGALEALEAVAARGRSLGVHLVATAQSTAGISRSLLVNLGLRVATGNVDPLELAQLGFKPSANPKAHAEMFNARLLASDLAIDFSFPLVASVTKSKQIHLIG